MPVAMFCMVSCIRIEMLVDQNSKVLTLDSHYTFLPMSFITVSVDTQRWFPRDFWLPPSSPEKFCSLLYSATSRIPQLAFCPRS